MQALVDIGNTRIKWALYDGKNLGQHGNAVHRGVADAALQTFAREVPRTVTRVIVANVAGDVMERRLRAVIGGRAEIDFVATTAERFGVRCAYAEPHRLGVDRWLGVLAAHTLAAGPACVIGAGTAVTFDAVAGDGAHLGGLILPGARLFASALGAEGCSAARSRHGYRRRSWRHARDRFRARSRRARGGAESWGRAPRVHHWR
jgi:type III pantothenate kinase